METTNKTTEHGVHNSKIHDNAAKIVFGDSTLCKRIHGYSFFHEHKARGY